MTLTTGVIEESRMQGPQAGDRVRRVIAVVDIVESVRLMQAFEADVIDRWRRFVAEVRAAVLPGLGGLMVKSLGDGMLLEFDAASRALEAAFCIQERVAGYNRDCSREAELWLRVGIHCAEVVRDELDIYGAGVNLAARLTSLAEPGAVLVSSAVRDDLIDELHATFEDLGDAYLKHLDNPVRAYRARRPGKPGHRERPILPDATSLKPGIAVIPFSCLGADPTFAAIGHALADDINAALSRSHELRVISRLSTAGFSGRAEPATNVRERLGAAYVVSGAYHVIGGRVRLNVELCDAREDRVLWATGLTAEVSSIFDSQDQLVPQIVTQVGREILNTELERTGRIPVPSLEGYSLYLGGVGLLHRLSGRDNERARELLQHVSDRHPRAAAPHAMLAKWHILRIVQGWSSDPRREATLARTSARRAVDLDEREAFALIADGLVSVLVEGDLDAGARRYLQALACNPHEPYGWALLAGLHTYRDDATQAELAAARALALSPLDPARFIFEAYVAFAKLGAGNYDGAAEWARSSLRLNVMHSASHRLLVMALSLAGRGEEASAAAKRLLAVDPGSTVSGYVSRYPAKNSPRARLYAQALQDAGVPI